MAFLTEALKGGWVRMIFKNAYGPSFMASAWLGEGRRGVAVRGVARASRTAGVGTQRKSQCCLSPPSRAHRSLLRLSYPSKPPTHNTNMFHAMLCPCSASFLHLAPFWALHRSPRLATRHAPPRPATHQADIESAGSELGPRLARAARVARILGVELAAVVALAPYGAYALSTYR